MNKLFRGVLIGAVAALTALSVTAPASAAVGDPVESQTACEREAEGYDVGNECQLTVSTQAAICIGDVSYLNYAVDARGTGSNTVTITFLNPTGANVVYPGLPLSGTLLWPGAQVDADGNGTDWPGWTLLPDGTWVEGDEFNWARPAVNVLFEANPQAQATVAYPPASAVCADPPSEVQSVSSEVLAAGEPAAPVDSEVLAATGSESGPLLVGAVGVLVVGAGLIGIVAFLRRRQYAATT